MFNLNDTFTDTVLDRIHKKTLSVLKNVGLRIECEDFHNSLKKKGAKISADNVVTFPEGLVEETVNDLKMMINNGKKQFILNGVISSDSSNMEIKFAGACIEFLDPISNKVREPVEKDLIQLIKLGQSIKEVTYVGNPVCYLCDNNGNKIDPKLQRIKTAAVVAKYTTKYGSNEVWNEKELDLLIELGKIVRGGEKEYFANPCFVTAKETIAPFVFPREDGKILGMLAKRNLPVTIIPMPISGASSPVSIEGNIVVTAAEILGVMVAIHSVYPEAMLSGGVISGILDMRFMAASFSAPEAIMQDLGVAMLFKKMYGQDFGIGTGCVDAQYVGSQLATEYFAKMSAAKLMGKTNYPVGNIGGAKRWSPQGAIVGMEIAKYLHRFDLKITADESRFPLELYKEVGIAGTFLGTEHTFDNFKSAFWHPQILERTQSMNPNDSFVEKSKAIWSDFINECDTQELAVTKETGKEIDKWLTVSEKLLKTQ